MKIGPYEIVAEVGRGGMGIVFRARTPEGREVAVKVLKAGATKAMASRFDRERRLQGQLGEEQGFVPLLDAGDGPEGPYLVMPFLPGGSLRDRLEKGRLEIGECESIGHALAEAVGAAHAQGLVHRDLKPENVLFQKESGSFEAWEGSLSRGKPLVADLGLAKHFDPESKGASGTVQISKSGVALGTFGYSAPEQLRDSKQAGPPADVFAIGAIVYECLAGKPACQASSIGELVQRGIAGTKEPLARA
ncbi:serine/threonine protein kinase, partial [bacterium]|nr:serine/threonine protein kinase [bacterium]